MRIRTAAVLVGALVAFLGTAVAGYLAAELKQPPVAPDRASMTWLFSVLIVGWITILPVYVAFLAVGALLFARRHGASFLLAAFGLFVGVVVAVALPFFGDETIWVVALPLACGGAVVGSLVKRFEVRSSGNAPTGDCLGVGAKGA